MRKSEIIRNLRKNQKLIGNIVDALGLIGSGDQTTKRHAHSVIVFTMFELMDSIGDVEIAIYNYLNKRGWK